MIIGNSFKIKGTKNVNDKKCSKLLYFNKFKNKDYFQKDSVDSCPRLLLLLT